MCQERFKRWIIVQTFFEPDFWKSDLRFIMEVKYSDFLFVCLQLLQWLCSPTDEEEKKEIASCSCAPVGIALVN